MSRKLAEFLLEAKLITKEQLKEAERAIESSPKLTYYLYFAHNKIVSESKLVDIVSKKYRIPSFDLDKYEISPDVISIFKPENVKKLSMIPVEKSDDTLAVAIKDPQTIQHVDDAKFLTQMNIELIFTTPSAFANAIDKYYGTAIKDMEALEEEIKVDLREQKELEKGEGSAVLDVLSGSASESYQVDEESRVPALKLVNSILVDAIRKKASDVHVENYEKKFRIRMRMDGTLLQTILPPQELHVPVIARIKIMAKMDISERRLPQDGRIKIKAASGEMDFRVSSVPTVTGEKIVLRALDKSALKSNINDIGFSQHDLEKFDSAIHSSNGIVLVTGPTGSGKTTTLYSGISTLNKVSQNISTVEDPVEFSLEGINQVQMHSEIGLNFATSLRAFMRQDPDIILVGEIRDKETAEIAVQAALTGHLVFSTLHTNDAVSTVSRLLNMGIEDFLLTAALKLVVAQRLLRTLCSKCKKKQTISKDKLRELDITPDIEEVPDDVLIYAPGGCSECKNVGYKGRTAIFEVLRFSKKLKSAVSSGVSSLELKKAAMSEGMRTLRMSALTKVMAGETSLEEAITKSESD